MPKNLDKDTSKGSGLTKNVGPMPHPAYAGRLRDSVDTSLNAPLRDMDAPGEHWQAAVDLGNWARAARAAD